MKILSDLLLPVIVVAINILLGARTGLPVFYLSAGVITALYVARLWRSLRRRP